MVYGHMCICDVELLYLRRLAAYLRRHPGFLWRIKTYTDLGACLKEMPEVLLVSGQALAEYGSREGDECFLEIVGCQIILLKDDSGYDGAWPVIDKYQSAKKLYEDLLEIFGEEAVEDTEVIGIYGPASGPEAERLAVEKARERLKNGEVLLISLAGIFHIPGGKFGSKWLG